MRRIALGLVLGVLLGGCSGFPRGTGGTGGSGGSGLDEDPPSGPDTVTAVAATCRPSGDVAARVEALYGATEQSVHEIITCGGLQLQVSQSLRLMIFASNEELISASAREDIRQAVHALGMTVDNPFVLQVDGSWMMPAGDDAGATFSLRFFDPTTDGPVTVDPFVLDSYLVGVTATSDMTWEQMKASPTRRATFSYAWQSEGPLAHLLNDGAPLPNPIVVRMSLAEIGAAGLGLLEPDYGPFDSVQDIEVDSQIHMVDAVGAVDVAYDVTGLRHSVREISSTEVIGFDVQSVASVEAELELLGDPASLEFVERGSLAGEINYRIRGGGVAVLVTSNFGAGSAYPRAEWSCP